MGRRRTSKKCRKKSRTGNVFASLESAAIEAEFVKQRSGDPVRAYQCAICKQFHIGKGGIVDRWRYANTVNSEGKRMQKLQGVYGELITARFARENSQAGREDADRETTLWIDEALFLISSSTSKLVPGSQDFDAQRKAMISLAAMALAFIDALDAKRALLVKPSAQPVQPVAALPALATLSGTSQCPPLRLTPTKQAKRAK